MKFKGIIIYKGKGTDDELVPIVDLDLENKVFTFVNPSITSELLNVNPTLNVKMEILIMKQYFYLKGQINLYASKHDIIDDDNYKDLLSFININNLYIDKHFKKNKILERFYLFYSIIFFYEKIIRSIRWSISWGYWVRF